MATFETADYAIDPTTDGFRARAVKHSVEGGAADGDFGLLTSQRPCPQTATDDGLVSPYRRLGQPTLSVAAGTLPFHLAASADSSDMPVPLSDTSVVDWLTTLARGGMTMAAAPLSSITASYVGFPS